MKITCIVGGQNDPSNSETLARAFLEGAANAGAETRIALLREKNIDAFTLRNYETAWPVETDFREIQEAIEWCDGLVVASPIWNFGIPANLKNVIDRCGSFGLDSETRTVGQWGGKPFYLLFTGGAPHAAWTGLFRKTTSFVPTALQYFGGVHVGTHFEPRCMTAKGVFGLTVDKRPESLAAVRHKGTEFTSVVRQHAQTGELPFKLRAKRRLYQVGQYIQRKFL